MQRNDAVKEPHYDLKDLCELDERLNAHLDGLNIAGEYAWELALQGLKEEEPGEVFVAAWLAVLRLDGKKLEQVLNIANSSSENYTALLSALAWHNIELTQGLLNSFLQANDSDYICLGIHLCALKRVDPQAALVSALASDNPALVIRALKAVGELGRKDLLGQLTPFYNSEDADYSFWSNWSALLLGDHTKAELLKFHVINSTDYADRALELVARVTPAQELKNFLQSLAQKSETIRFAMRGAGVSGDPFWIAGILKYMQQAELARICGEAFVLITGVDLSYQDLDSDQPSDFVLGPNEDPEDEDVTLDADDDLAWPSIELVSQWWREHAHQFTLGQRYLCGEPITQANCNNVLIKGYQRQRIAASFELALMGKGLFPTSALGKYQQQLLSKF